MRVVPCWQHSVREAVRLVARDERLTGPGVVSDPPAQDPGGATAVYRLLDQLAESVLVASPVWGADGRLADFIVLHLSPGFVDPAGRAAAALSGLTLLQAYPDSASGDGLFARAARVLADGHPQYVPGLAGPPRTGPLTGKADAAAVADLRAAPYAGRVVFTWRGLRAASDEDGRLAEMLDQVQRIGRLGGWEEDLRTGSVRWTEAAYAVFGLDPVHASPIPISELDRHVADADRALVIQFRQSLLRDGEPAAAVFSVVRPQDGALRQIRVFADPLLERGDPLLTPSHPALARGDVVALRGAFQDVTALYQTQVALAETRGQLADSEQRAAEEHELAVRLQRAIMPSGVRPVETAGVDIAVRYRPAMAGSLVAGDWYDVLQLASGDLLLVVGDIVGHGIEAVTGMVAARNALRGLAVTEAEPHELLSQLNYAACRFTEGVTGTVICGRYNPRTREFRWARAGHLPPVLVRGSVAVVQPAPEGMMLGVELDTDFEQVTLQLRTGDTLLLYTDGLIERRAVSISDALAEFAAAAVPAGPDADSHAARIMASTTSDTGDDACLLAVRIL
jgi:serine phosphatase RsbU (regulator of sigma subunit)/PAS domain-containing protein